MNSVWLLASRDPMTNHYFRSGAELPLTALQVSLLSPTCNKVPSRTRELKLHEPCASKLIWKNCQGHLSDYKILKKDIYNKNRFFVMMIAALIILHLKILSRLYTHVHTHVLKFLTTSVLLSKFLFLSIRHIESERESAAIAEE